MKSIKRIYIVSALLLAIAGSLYSQNQSSFEINDVVYVKSEIGLNMRESPNLSAAVVTLLANNARVIINEIDSQFFTIQGETSQWLRVRYNSFVGWIFGGFVSEQGPNQGKNSFRYYLSNGKADSYSLYIGMKISDSILIFGEPERTVGFQGQTVRIYNNPLLNIYGMENIEKISWGDDSCGAIFGILPKVTSEDDIFTILGVPDDVKIIQPDMDGEAINVGTNYFYTELNFELLININEENKVDYIQLYERS